MATKTEFFVDTSVLVAHLRQKAPTIFNRASAAYGIPVVSDAVVFELEVGARRAGRIDEFYTYFPTLSTYPISQAILLDSAGIHAELVRQNQIIGVLDTIIAATALYHGLPLFTLNVKHFSRIPYLTLLPVPQ